MNNKIWSFLLIITFSYLSISCQSKSKHIELVGVDEGLATFKVVNTTNEDISSISFELTYLNANDEVIKVDTVNYKMEDRSSDQVWLKADGSTIIAQKVPESTITASGKIISITN